MLFCLHGALLLLEWQGGESKSFNVDSCSLQSLDHLLSDLYRKNLLVPVLNNLIFLKIYEQIGGSISDPGENLHTFMANPFLTKPNQNNT